MLCHKGDMQGDELVARLWGQLLGQELSQELVRAMRGIELWVHNRCEQEQKLAAALAEGTEHASLQITGDDDDDGPGPPWESPSVRTVNRLLSERAGQADPGTGQDPGAAG